jgi:hypothetical protein
VVRDFGIGITNTNLNRVAVLGEKDIDLFFAKKIAGKIFIQVENRGEAWYISPVDYKKYYLGRPVDMLEAMRKLGLGITNNDLSKISILSQYNEPSLNSCIVDSWTCGDWSDCSPSGVNNRICNLSFDCVNVDTPSPVVSRSCVYTPAICDMWTYSDWSACSALGLQTRTVRTSGPDGCGGGNPILVQSCNPNFSINISANNQPYFTIESGISTEISFKLFNNSTSSSGLVSGFTIENILDVTSGINYYNQTYLSVFDSQNNLLAKKNLVNDSSNLLTFSSPIMVESQSSTTFMVKIDGFGGNSSSPHFIVRLINLFSDSSRTIFTGLPVDSNIYRK